MLSSYLRRKMSQGQYMTECTFYVKAMLFSSAAGVFLLSVKQKCPIICGSEILQISVPLTG